MGIDINQFWQLLKQSRLVELSKIQSLVREFEKEFAAVQEPPASGQNVAQWLVGQNVLTPYQARILLSGKPGPMSFGGYVLTDKIQEGPRSGTFKALHRATNFPVNLQFMQANDTSDLRIWRQIEVLAERVNTIDHPNLVSIFETVTLPDYRFVVTESSIGTPLSEIVPWKARLPWRDACFILAQIANGLQNLHDLGIVHNAISPRSIWASSGNRARLMMGLIPEKNFENSDSNVSESESRYDYLAPESLSDQPQVDSKSDLYALGCTMHRLITGRTVYPSHDVQQKIEQHRTSQPKDLSKYKVPPRLQRLQNELLTKDPLRRPDSAKLVGELLLQLSEHAEWPQPKLIHSKQEQSYRRAIKSWNSLVNPFVSVDGAISIDTGADPALENRSSSEERIAAAQMRKKSKLMLPLSVGAAIIALSGVIGALAFRASQTPIKIATEISSVQPVVPASPVKPRAEQLELELPEVNLVQNLIDDDEHSLWESPTTGLPVDFSFVPPAPKLIFVFRPAEIWADNEGKLLLKSLGPELQSRIETWRSHIGIAFEDIAQVVMSFHSEGEPEFDSFFVVRLTEPTNLDSLLDAWQNPPFVEIDENRKIYDVEGIRSMYPVPTENGQNVTQFLYGDSLRIREVIESDGNVLSGTMNQLSRWSDAGRHFTFMFLRPSLFNEQGQALMTRKLSVFNRQLNLFLQDEIRGGLVSLHLDRGTYIEIILDQTVDLDSFELKDSLEQRLRDQRDRITQFVATIPASLYWDKVRLKYDNMLADVYRNLRWDVEYKAVIGNCWLPPMAAHNLVAATELLLAFSKGASSDVPTNVDEKVPSTLEELLGKKRTLEVSTNPDLNILLKGIQTEVLDEYGKLPFEFNIRLLGNDLQKEGITQNQRPGEFKMIDQSLAEILTEIMVRCNPNKDISGPSDVNCKLIWAIGPDPDNPEDTAILITTRQGAAEKGLTLPASFRGD